MKSKSLKNIILATVVEGALCVGSEALAKEKDVYDSLIKEGKVEANTIYRLGKEDKAFDFFNDKTVVNGKILDVKSEDFHRLLQRNFGNRGDEIYNFLSQENAVNFGIATDESDRVLIYSQVGNKMMSTPDDSIKTNIFELKGKEAVAMSNLVRSKNSIQTALVRTADDSNGVVVDLKGVSPEGFNNSLRLNVRKGFKLNPFMSKNELEKFTEESGIRVALNDFLGYGDVINLIKDPENTIRVNYKVRDSKAEVYFSVVGGNQVLLVPRGPYESNLVDIPKENFNCGNPDDTAVLGLEEVIVASSQDSLVVASADTPAVRKEPSVRGLGIVGKKEGSISLEYVVGAGYPLSFVGGVGKKVGDFTITGFAGYTRSINESNEVFSGKVDPNGNQIRIRTNSSKEGGGVLSGVNFGYPITKKFSVVFGGYGGVEQSQFTGSSVPEQYRGNDLVRVKQPQTFSRKTNSGYAGGSLGLSYKNLLLQATRDTRGRNGVRAILKIPEVKK